MMKKILLLSTICIFAFCLQAKSQTRFQVFDTVLFYDGYNNLEKLETDGHWIQPLPEGFYRLNTSIITTKLSEEQLNLLSGSIEMLVVTKAACDNYDRLGHVRLVLLPKDSATYTINTVVKRLEIARMVTPFMDMNKQPDTVPFIWQIDNLQHVFQDQYLRETYNFWLELSIFGVPYAANTEIAGCGGRSDVIYGSLWFTTTPSETAALETDNVFIPIFSQRSFNNREGGTDEVGKTIRSVEIEIEEDLTDAQFVLITSNHGANSGGEEYIRRWHYVYFNEKEVYRYRPGRRSCEPFRKWNTQPNGIYQFNPQTDERWQSFSNWCPGDVIDTRIIKLGAVSAGTHKFTIDVPDATFAGNQGNFPLSLYFQGKKNGTIVGETPKRYTVRGIVTDRGVPMEEVIMGGRFSNTNESGEYFAIVDSATDAIISPNMTGFKFAPASHNCAWIAGDSGNINFATGISVALSRTPSVGGTVIGAGNYAFDTECTVIARSNANYVLGSWTENGYDVSTDTVYTFIATVDRSLRANFVSKSSIQSNLDEMGVVIYPNPSNGLINVKVSENSVVKIFDLTGKQLGIYDVMSDSKLSLNKSPGIYFIHVESDGKKASKKIIVQ
jgi:hypothetical protein